MNLETLQIIALVYVVGAIITGALARAADGPRYVGQNRNGASAVELSPADAEAARDLLRELGEWPKPAAEKLPPEELCAAFVRVMNGPRDTPHEPTREELADLHEPERDGESVDCPDEFQRQVDALVDERPSIHDINIGIHPRSRCESCGGCGTWETGEGFVRRRHVCNDCRRTGRRHVNGKPWYCAEEVAAHNARKCACAGFPGGLGQP